LASLAKVNKNCDLVTGVQLALGKIARGVADGGGGEDQLAVLLVNAAREVSKIPLGEFEKLYRAL
jgi:hypothetical protein